MGGGKGTLGELLSVWGSKPAHLFDPPPPGAQAAAIPSNLQQSPANWNNIQRVHKECIKLHRNRIKYTESISKRYSFWNAENGRKWLEVGWKKGIGGR